MAAWTKAITAFLTGLVGVLAQFGITAEWGRAGTHQRRHDGSEHNPGVCPA